MKRAFLAAALVALPVIAAADPEPTPSEPVPEGVTQIVPRGRLASIDEPKFVPGHEASIPDEQWVLGIEIDGVAHAYDLNLLNHREVVNDAIGDRPIAAVW